MDMVNIIVRLCQSQRLIMFAQVLMEASEIDHIQILFHYQVVKYVIIKIYQLNHTSYQLSNCHHVDVVPFNNMHMYDQLLAIW